MSELRPCPNENREYGHKIITKNYAQHGLYTVMCSCGWRSPLRLDRKSAIDAWNTRAADVENTRLRGLVEEAKEIMEANEPNKDWPCFSCNNVFIHSPKCRYEAWKRKVNDDQASG